jgi:hypothetical protein
MADYFPAVLIRFFSPSSKRICATRQMSPTKARPIETMRLTCMARAPLDRAPCRCLGAWAAPQAFRTHLPPPPPLSDHRRQRGFPEAEGRGIFVRIYGGGEALEVRARRCVSNRHCERSEAIQLRSTQKMDCFVATLLAMTECLNSPAAPCPPNRDRADAVAKSSPTDCAAAPR